MDCIITIDFYYLDFDLLDLLVIVLRKTYLLNKKYFLSKLIMSNLMVIRTNHDLPRTILLFSVDQSFTGRI